MKQFSPIRVANAMYSECGYTFRRKVTNDFRIDAMTNGLPRQDLVVILNHLRKFQK